MGKCKWPYGPFVLWVLSIKLIDRLIDFGLIVRHQTAVAPALTFRPAINITVVYRVAN